MYRYALSLIIKRTEFYNFRHFSSFAIEGISNMQAIDLLIAFLRGIGRMPYIMGRGYDTGVA
jgi:hypothetical protein